MEHNPAILLDTGPLVAFLSKRERHHPWVKEQCRQFAPPFLTCEPVLAEACHILRRTSGEVRPLWQLFQTGFLSIAFEVQEEQKALSSLMQKYASLPMSLADACLVRMAEQIPNSIVFTLDGHFSIYRKNGRQTIPVLHPGA